MALSPGSRLRAGNFLFFLASFSFFQKMGGQCFQILVTGSSTPEANIEKRFPFHRLVSLSYHRRYLKKTDQGLKHFLSSLLG